MSDRQANGETPSVAAGAVIAPGDARQAARLLTFGIYLAGSSTMLLLSSRDDRARSLGPVLGMAAFGVMQIVLGVMGMNAG